MIVHSYTPEGCHLWKSGNPTSEQLRKDLVTVKVYVDDTHLFRALRKCKDCGQLYFYEFYEWIDWDEGNDPQYSTWVPVRDEADADALSKCSSLELTGFTAIRSDFPADAKTVSAPKWVISKR